MRRANLRLRVGAAILLLVLLISIFAGIIAPADPAASDLSVRLRPPGEAGLLGTDHLGRDVFSRLLYGARLSAGIPVLVLAISALTGTLLGMLAGYYRGVVDRLVTTAAEILLAFPGMVLSLAIAGILGAGVRNAVIAVAVVSWTGYARLVRAATLSLRERDFVKAARLAGSSDRKILLRHILPNLLPSVAVYAATNVSSIVMQLAALSFLGLGVQLPAAEWGAMLNEARGFITAAPWLTLAPCAALVLMVTGFQLLGEGIAQRLQAPGRRSNESA